MSLKKIFGTSKKKETEGVWIEGPYAGASCLIARFGNPASIKLGAELMRPHKAAQRAGRLDDKILTAITIKVMARTILLGWKGMKDEESGPDIEYTPEAAAARLEAFPDFRNFVAENANDIAQYLEDEERAAVKN